MTMIEFLTKSFNNVNDISETILANFSFHHAISLAFFFGDGLANGVTIVGYEKDDVNAMLRHLKTYKVCWPYPVLKIHRHNLHILGGYSIN